MRRTLLCILLIFVTIPDFAQRSGKTSDLTGAYYPEKEWRRKTPAEVGIDPALLKAAIDYAMANETGAPADLKLNHYRSFGREPFGDAIGPLKDRGSQTGIIIRNGYVIAEWGNPYRIDIVNTATPFAIDELFT